MRLPFSEETVSTELSESNGAVTVSEKAPISNTKDVSKEHEVHRASEDLPTDPMAFLTMPDLDELTLKHSKQKQKKKRKIVSMSFVCAAIFQTSMTAMAPLLMNPTTFPKNVALHMQSINTHFNGTLNELHHDADCVVDV